MDEQFEYIWANLQALWVQLQAPLVQIKNSKISVVSILFSIAAIALTFFIARLISSAIDNFMKSRGVDSGVRTSVRKFSRYLVIALGFLFALDNLGISISSFAALGAVLMVGIGFGLQNITQNFISGIIILIERPIKAGDIIRVGSSSGRVIDIRVRSSIIQTRDGLSIIVPNSKILSEEVISDSYSGELTRQHIKIGVAYGTDVDKVRELLRNAAQSNERVLKDPRPRALLMDFGESSLDFDLRFWCSDIWEMEQISSEIRLAIVKSFHENKIQIPFPQRDIHILTQPPADS